MNLAYEAARAGARVLLWDLDPQGAATFFFRVKPRRQGRRRAAGRRTTATLAEHIRGHRLAGGLHMVPADFSLRHLDLHLDDTKRPTRAARRAARSARRSDYDVAILDCPPGITLASESVFAAADALLVPTIPATLVGAHARPARPTSSVAWTIRPLVLPFLSMIDRRRTVHRELAAALAADVAAPAVDAGPQRRRPSSAWASSGRRWPCSPRPVAGTIAYRDLWAEIAASCGRVRTLADGRDGDGRRDRQRRAVMRDGDHVLRPSNPHTPTIHAFLRFLRAEGSRRPATRSASIRTAASGCEYIAGDVAVPPYPAWAQTDMALATAAALLRRLHDVSARYVPPPDATWSAEMADPERRRPVICHNDVCLENIVYRNQVAVGLLDFDFAAPGRRVYDLAAFARMCVPMDTDDDAVLLGRTPPFDPFRRLRIVADAYGLRRDRDEFLDAVADGVERGGAVPPAPPRRGQRGVHRDGRGDAAGWRSSTVAGRGSRQPRALRRRPRLKVADQSADGSRHSPMPTWRSTHSRRGVAVAQLVVVERRDDVRARRPPGVWPSR